MLAKAHGDILALRKAAFCGFSQACFVQAQDVDAIGCEFPFVAAGVGMRAGDEAAREVEQVAEGPIMAFEERPEGDEDFIQLRVVPEAIFLAGHDRADDLPLRRIFESPCCVGVVPFPEHAVVVVHGPEVALAEAEGREFARFGVLVEHRGHVMRGRVRCEVICCIEPVAPALDGSLDGGVGGGRAADGLHRGWVQEIGAAVGFESKGDGGAAKGG